jgi:hypothetical protein
MWGQPTVVFEREPVSWVLFNIFVMLAEKKDTRDHGNYYESLYEAFNTLDSSRHTSFSFQMVNPMILAKLAINLKKFTPWLAWNALNIRTNKSSHLLALGKTNQNLQ